jgi:hypothetical protein
VGSCCVPWVLVVFRGFCEFCGVRVFRVFLLCSVGSCGRGYYCHPERSEGSRGLCVGLAARETLRFTQGDSGLCPRPLFGLFGPSVRLNAARDNALPTGTQGPQPA